MCMEVAPPTVDPIQLEAKGGCACEAAGHGGAGQSAPAALGLVGIALAALRRRRKA